MHHMHTHTHFYNAIHIVAVRKLIQWLYFSLDHFFYSKKLHLGNGGTIVLSDQPIPSLLPTHENKQGRNKGSPLSLHTQACMYATTPTYTHTTQHTHTHAHTHTRVCMHAHTGKAGVKALRTCTHTYAHACTQTCTHARTLAHTHTLTGSAESSKVTTSTFLLSSDIPKLLKDSEICRGEHMHNTGLIIVL